ncbi:MAG: DUF1365 domain-containing protein [Hyphomicrobiaceae bacterium]
MALTTNSWIGRWFAPLWRDPIARGLLQARITHVRLRPKHYALSHRLTYLHVSMADLDRLPRLFFGHNRFALFSLRDRDYGQGDRSFLGWVAAAFASVGAALPQGHLSLLTLPRVAGFGFNPVSFWLCHDEDGALCAVLAEVNNTFGERHSYLCRKADGSPIGAADEIEAEKVFHVSPFMPVSGSYRFRFAEAPDRLRIEIHLFRDDQLAFSASIFGDLEPLTSAGLAKSFLRHPFPTLQVVALIHYHAVRIYVAGHQFFSKPTPPRSLITRSDRATDARSLEKP